MYKCRDSLWRILTLLVMGCAFLSPTGIARAGLGGPFDGFRDYTAELLASQISNPTHYIIFEIQPDGSVRPLNYRLVSLQAPLVSLDDARMTTQLQSADRNVQHFMVSLRSKSGKNVYQSVVDVPRWIRGEFHGAGDNASIDGHIFPLEQAVFVVRVPALPGTTLVLQDRHFSTLASFDLQALAQETPKIELPSSTSLLSAPADEKSANRVDLLIMGDGYTAAQQSKFTTDSLAILADFFNITPLAEYKNYVISHTLFVASNQSGADHPPYQSDCPATSDTCCGDTEMNSDPLAGTMVDTALDATYCAYNIHRLLVIDSSLVYAAAAAVPDWDQILVIVNDSTYGGSGGYFGTISMNSLSPQIAQHEYGHIFVDLADEYDTPYPGFPACSDAGAGPACEVNVTDVSTRAQIKWAPWIKASTPVPTVPEFSSEYADVVGLFEGARYFSSGMYRPGQNCLMRALGTEFCQVPSQAYVLRLYEGGWGTPANGISLIEPQSATPEEATLKISYPGERVFHADILQPVGGPPADIQWRVDGNLVATGSDTFTYTTAASDRGKSFEISLEVIDTTELVHPAMAGSALQDSHSWTVAVAGAFDSVTIHAPTSALLNSEIPFSTTLVPLTATLPLTYTWVPEPLAGQGAALVTYTWDVVGAQSVVVSVTNASAEVVTDTHAITIVAPQSLYLPVLLQASQTN